LNGNRRASLNNAHKETHECEPELSLLQILVQSNNSSYSFNSLRSRLSDTCTAAECSSISPAGFCSTNGWSRIGFSSPARMTRDILGRCSSKIERRHRGEQIKDPFVFLLQDKHKWGDCDMTHMFSLVGYVVGSNYYL
jgi:hypothetical protein